MRPVIQSLAFLLLLSTSAPAFAQVCPHGPVNTSELISTVSKAARQFQQYHQDDQDNSGPWVPPEIIYRSAAIGGQALIPALRRVSKPGMPPNTIPGAAQVSLAKLGDRASLNEIEQDLEFGRSEGYPAQKLGRVGSQEAVRVLLKYFFAHAADPSRYHDYGDYGVDDMMAVLEPLATFVRNPPTFGGPGGSASGDPKDWAAWWDHNRANPLAFSISANLHDPFTQCLARKVEWGFPEAILDLGTSRDPQAIPALRALTQLGDQRLRASSFRSIRGRAQAALAKLGDADEFNAIVGELESPSSDDAAFKLQYIGGKKAAEALLESLNGTSFLAGFPDWKFDGAHAPGVIQDHDEAIERALIKMVISPPDTTGEQRNKNIWLSWWANNKNTAKFRSPPSDIHE